jgi:hypothetical protein
VVMKSHLGYNFSKSPKLSAFADYLTILSVLHLYSETSVGTSHNPTNNLTPSIGESLLPKAYGKAPIFIQYQPANQRSQQQH